MTKLRYVRAINATTIEVTWSNGETTEVELEEELEAGENEVTFEIDGVEYTETVTFEAPEAIELNVLNTQLPLRDDVVVSYQLLDQYGTDVDADSSDLTVTAYNVTQGESIAVDNISTADDKVELDLAAAGVELEDEVRVTLLHNDSGVKETVTLPVVAAEAVSEVTLGQPVLAEDVERLPENTNDITLEYSAVDQYGNDVTLENTDDLTFLSSDESVVSSDSITVVENEDEEMVLTFDTQDVAEAQDVTITALVNSTGETSQTTFTVYADPTIESASLAKQDDSVIAEGDSVTFDIMAEDQYGNELTGEEIVSFADEINFSSSNEGVIDADDYTINEDGTVTFNTVNEGTARIFATVGGETSELTIDVEAPRVATELEVLESPSMKLLPTATTTMEVAVVDQYGEEMAAPGADYDIQVESDSADVTVVEDSEGNYTVTGASEGEATLTTSLVQDVDGDGDFLPEQDGSTDTVVDSFETDVEVIADSAEGLTYSIEEQGTLYALDTDNDGDVDVDDDYTASDYTQAVNIVATDADGDQVAVPGSYINDVLTSDSDVLEVNGDNTVYGVSEGTATLTVVVETSEGVQTLTQEVTVSGEEPATQNLEVSSDSYEIATSFTSEEIEDDEGLFFTATDQYGVENAVDVSYYATGVEDGATVTFTDANSDGSTEMNVTGTLTEGEEFTVTGISSNGKSVSTTVNVVTP